MKKKDYQTPTMHIVKLQHQTHLMAGSVVQAGRSGYDTANSDVPVGELNGGIWIWE